MRIVLNHFAEKRKSPTIEGNSFCASGEPRMSKRLLFALLVISLLMILALPAAAQQYDPNAPLPHATNPASVIRTLEGYLIVDTDNLFLRSGDGPQYTPIALIDGGTRLVVLGRNQVRESGLWWYVQVGMYRGWVTNEFVVGRGDLTDAPVIEARGEITPPTLFVGVNNLVYSRPGSIRVLCEIAGNTQYFVTGRDATAENWYRIEVTCDGVPTEGWIVAEAGFLRNPGGVSIPIIDT